MYIIKYFSFFFYFWKKKFNILKTLINSYNYNQISSNIKFLSQCDKLFKFLSPLATTRLWLWGGFRGLEFNTSLYNNVRIKHWGRSVRIKLFLYNNIRIKCWGFVFQQIKCQPFMRSSEHHSWRGCNATLIMANDIYQFMVLNFFYRSTSSFGYWFFILLC